MIKTKITKTLCVLTALLVMAPATFAADNEAKLAKMSEEQRAEYLAKQAEKEAAAAEKAAAKEAAAAEKAAAQAEKKAAKEAAAAEKAAAKQAALEAKLASMTPEQRAKYDKKQADKAAVKAYLDKRHADRTEARKEYAQQVELPEFKIVYEYGIEGIDVTRIIVQNDRSNYVFKDTLAGAYFLVKTDCFTPINPLIKVSALMGMGNTFNDASYKTSTFNYGVDGFLGLDYKISFWDYLFLNLTPGVHALYQNADRFDYINLGVGGYASAELPVGYEWTVVVGGQITYDWGNYGTNKLLETYDAVWQTSFDLGIRYSKKNVNKYNYCGDTEKSVQEVRDFVKAKKQAKKDAKKAKAEARKAAQAEAKAAKDANQQ